MPSIFAPTPDERRDLKGYRWFVKLPDGSAHRVDAFRLSIRCDSVRIDEFEGVVTSARIAPKFDAVATLANGTTYDHIAECFDVREYPERRWVLVALMSLAEYNRTAPRRERR